MKTLQELSDRTKTIIESGELKIPEPSVRWKDTLDNLWGQGLRRKWERCLMDMRIEQAKMAGFEMIETSEMVEMLMGEPHNHTEEAQKRQDHEWIHNHHTGTILCGEDCNWGGPPEDFILMGKDGMRKKEIWRVRFGCLDYLERNIPYGVLLLLNELKKVKLFNAFSVMAPVEAWEHQTDIDPIVVGSIWELPRTKDGYHDAGDTAHFFLAQW